MLSSRGHAKVIDFGLAKQVKRLDQAELETQLLTTEGATFGTLPYMSPEQLKGQQVTAQSDIFSYGIVLYEMITGIHPFKGPSSTVTIAAILSEDPIPSSQYVDDVPRFLDRIVEKTLARDLSQRYKTIHEVRADLGYVRLDGRRERPEKQVHPSIAVLPLDNLSPDPDVEYFGEGMLEEITIALSRVCGIRVASRTSAIHCKNRSLDIGEIGSQLDVTNVLEGSIRRSGSRLRLTATLIDVESGFQLWSESFDRMIEEIFTTQEEIAQKVVEQLRVRLVVGRPSASVRSHSNNTEAYTLYLKGRHLANRREGEALRKGIECFKEAIEKDASYALAYAGLADAYSLMGLYSLAAPLEVFPESIMAARKALDLNRGLAEPHVSLAIGKFWFEKNWSEAEEEFQLALQLDQRLSAAYGWYSNLQAYLGKADEATRNAAIACELEPLSPSINAMAAWTYYILNRLEDALSLCRKALEIDPSYTVPLWVSSLIYKSEGAYDKAFDALQRGVALSGRSPFFLSLLSHLYAETGARREALEILSELTDRADREHVAAVYFAWMHIGLGDQEAGMDCLEMAIDEGGTLFFSFKDPMVAHIVDGSRFKDLLSRIGLEGRLPTKDTSLREV
jgi:serine/threonine-protein kinase